MSGRPLAITERQIVTIIRAAQKAGGYVEVETAMGVMRVFPTSPHRREQLHQEPVDDEPKGHL